MVGALPFWFDSLAWDSALFEAISGFSCTGSTVLADIESHGRGVLMWRQLTQWYGGMGMVVLAVSVLPKLRVGGLELIGAEAPGQSDRLEPRVRPDRALAVVSVLRDHRRHCAGAVGGAGA